MTRAELIVAVADAAKVDRKTAERTVAATFDAIKNALIEGDKVQILGFGTFENRIAASKLPSFKAGKSLKEACNQ